MQTRLECSEKLKDTPELHKREDNMLQPKFTMVFCTPGISLRTGPISCCLHSIGPSETGSGCSAHILACAKHVSNHSKLAPHQTQNSSPCYSLWAGHQAPRCTSTTATKAPGKSMRCLSLLARYKAAVRVKAPGLPTFKDRICVTLKLPLALLNQNKNRKAACIFNPRTWEVEAERLPRVWCLIPRLQHHFFASDYLCTFETKSQSS